VGEAQMNVGRKKERKKEKKERRKEIRNTEIIQIWKYKLGRFAT
jgi:hypothetical protein